MEAKLKVIRFRNEDVIATSGLCDRYGDWHFLANGEYMVEQLADGDYLEHMYGMVYEYDSENGLTENPGWFPVVPISDPDSLIKPEAGAFYYCPLGGNWQICPNQNHGH